MTTALPTHRPDETSVRTAVRTPSQAAPVELPTWRSVLAVVAHPDDESLGLGGVLDAFARAGAEVTVLCLTPGESYSPSPVSGDLLPLRRAQLAAAAKLLGVARVELRDHPAGHLDAVATHLLVDDIATEIDTWQPDGLVVFDEDGVNGSADHVVATRAAVQAASMRGPSVLAWGLPADVATSLNEETGRGRFTAVGPGSFAVRVDREHQRMATLGYAHHASPDTVPWRRLELLHDIERLRWLRRAPADQTRMLVTYDAGDRFAIDIRGHRILVDQPESVGGDDLAPTPTELFVASLASCVGFYARRYLARHRLDASGLTVEVAYDMAAKPSRVGEVTLRIVVPAGVPEERRAGLLAQAGHCTVHNSISAAPEIALDLA